MMVRNFEAHVSALTGESPTVPAGDSQVSTPSPWLPDQFTSVHRNSNHE